MAKRVQPRDCERSRRSGKKEGGNRERGRFSERSERTGKRKRRGENETYPDINLLVQSLTRMNIEQFRSSVRHGGVFGCDVLLCESFLTSSDVDSSRETGSEIHKDGSLAVVGDHDVAERRKVKEKRGREGGELW